MRVLLTGARGRTSAAGTGRPRQDEQGAVVLMVALMVVVFALLSAFAVDFGMAYNSKRQLQTSADAAALAAASVYAQHVDECTSTVIAAHLAEARTVAQRYVTENSSSVQQNLVMDDFDARCDSGELLVDVEVSADTQAVFGGITGTGPTLTTSRAASAAVDVPPDGPGLRPLAICASEMPPGSRAGDPWRIFGPGGGHVPPADCPVPSTPGNWWTLDCPRDEPRGQGTVGIEQQIRHGCTDPVTIVEGQGDLTGPALDAQLDAACPGESLTAPYQCLSGDPGAPDAGQTRDSWKHLIDTGERFLLPVFCAPSTCASSSIASEGTNAVFPVHKLVSASICGYHFGKQLDRRYVQSTPSADCRTSALLTARSELMADSTDRNYLLLSFQRLQVSGSTREFDCALGDPDCDGGARRVRLAS